MHVKSKRRDEFIEDETACGPLCQHPACWQSNQRVEKGFPKVKNKETFEEETDFEIPKLTIFNIIEDDTLKDEIISRYKNLPSSERRRLHRLSSSQRRDGTPGSHKIPPVPLATPAPTLSPFLKPKHSQTSEDRKKIKMVEVQEVFDVDDLNNTWDNTFLSKKCYVWVPNPNRTQQKQKPDAIDSTTTGQLSKDNTLLVKDVTEEMVPEEVEIQRMNSIVKRHHQRNRSPTSRNRPYPQSPHPSTTYKPEFDAEGISELLDLPRDVLFKVLEHTKQSDFSSKEIIHEIIKQFLPEWDPEAARKHHILHQRKLPLKENRMRNVRQPEMMISRPIFHLDRPNGMTSRDSPDKEILDFDVNAYVAYKNPNLLKEIPRYKRPLPAISGQTRSEGSGSLKKMPNISLGLPVLPSGIQATKPFTYKQNFLDFSLGPVPTPPGSIRSSAGSPSSNHGTSIKETGRSQSQRLDVEMPNVQKEYRLPSETTIGDRNSVEWSPNQNVSPSLSSRALKGPYPTPAAATGYHSPSKNSTMRYGSVEGTAVQRESSSAHRLNKSPNSQPSQLSPEHTGLHTIDEADDLKSRSEAARSKYNVAFGDKKEHVIPPQRPPSPQDHLHAKEEQKEASKIRKSPNALNISIPSPEKDEQTPRQIVSASSPETETWPEVVEKVFIVDDDNAVEEKVPEKGDNLSEHVQQPPRTPVSREKHPDSRGSDRSGHGKKIIDAHKTESPAPPPPSPEGREFIVKDLTVDEPIPKVYTEGRSIILEDRSGRRLNLPSRESSVMTPLFEESEPTESDRDAMFVHPSSTENAVTSSDTTPSTQKQSVQKSVVSSSDKEQNEVNVSREKTVDTFINVDIPASGRGKEEDKHQSSKKPKVQGDKTKEKSQDSIVDGAEQSLKEQNTANDEIMEKTVSSTENAASVNDSGTEAVSDSLQQDVTCDDKQHKTDHEQVTMDSVLEQNINTEADSDRRDQSPRQITADNESNTDVPVESEKQEVAFDTEHGKSHTEQDITDSVPEQVVDRKTESETNGENV